MITIQEVIFGRLSELKRKITDKKISQFSQAIKACSISVKNKLSEILGNQEGSEQIESRTYTWVKQGLICRKMLEWINRKYTEQNILLLGNVHTLAWEYLDTVYPDFKMSCEKGSLYPKEIPKCGQDNSTVR